jgi:hypothetical protein
MKNLLICNGINNNSCDRKTCVHAMPHDLTTFWCKDIYCNRLNGKIVYCIPVKSPFKEEIERILDV